MASVSGRTSWDVDAESELDTEASQASFDSIARREMGLSAAEFLTRWDRGDYEGVDMDDVPGLVATWMALPLVR